MQHFPQGRNIVLSEYALNLLGDPHALDVGKPARSKLNHFLQKTYGNKDLENHGILEDLASITVASKGILTSYLSSVSLIDLDQIPIKAPPLLWVFENNNTATRLHKEKIDIPYLIASGHPNRAVKTLLKRIIEQNTIICYHGDMDVSGVTIAQNLQKEFPEIKFPFMTKTHFREFKPIPAPKTQKGKTDFSILGLLKEEIIKTQSVVYEEMVNLRLFKTYSPVRFSK